MTDASSPGAEAVDAYLATLSPEQRATLDAVRATLRSLLPHATEALKYAMPGFTLDGKGVAGYGAFKDHCGYFPMSGSVLEAAGDAVAGYETSKGGITFPIGGRLPKSLIRRLVKLRLAELAAVTDGRRIEHYEDGQRKAIGQMRDGRLHGSWTWYRRDGSVQRTGRFRDGQQTGTWTTYDRAGVVVKTTER